MDSLVDTHFIEQDTASLVPVRRAGPRILVCAHAHPRISKGGAEVAAYELFRRVGAAPGHEAFLLAGAREDAYARCGSAITQPFSDSEFIYSVEDFDWFNFANHDRRFPAALTSLLHRLSPDIVHFHHYAHFGVEAFLHVRRALPQARIVVTLHEFLAICNHSGQMVKPDTFALCRQSSPVACSKCFPSRDAADFFLRKRYVQHFFRFVDHFISPSAFLAERYAEWGIPREKLSVIENVTAPPAARQAVAAPPPPRRPGMPLRVGFFGQISRLKGIDVLLDAAEILGRDEGAPAVAFEINGDDSAQTEAFRTRFRARLETAGPNVRLNGRYDSDQVDELMAGVDVVVMPSIWWENAPVVIREAIRNRRPVICSDIGGMREKIEHGRTGLHFPVGNAPALAAVLADLARTPDRLAAFAEGMDEAQAEAETPLASHLRLYEALVEGASL